MAENLISKLVPHQGCVITPSMTASRSPIGDELGNVRRRGAIRLPAAVHLSHRRQDGQHESPMHFHRGE
jgi:hypothetical protein